MIASSTFRDWRCRCGRLLFRVDGRTAGRVEVKCARCKTAQIVTLNTSRLVEASSWG